LTFRRGRGEGEVMSWQSFSAGIKTDMMVVQVQEGSVYHLWQ